MWLGLVGLALASGWQGTLRVRGTGAPLACEVGVGGHWTPADDVGRVVLDAAPTEVAVRCPDRAVLAVEVDGDTLWVTLAATAELVVTGDAAPSWGEEVLDADALRRVPGSWGDPMRGVGTLAGIARPRTVEGELAVHGAEAHHTGWLLDGVPVPRLFHWGLGRSVIDPAWVDGLRWRPGPLPVEVGGVIQSTVDVGIRRVEGDGRVHGLVAVDPLDLGASFGVRRGPWEATLSGRMGLAGAAVAGGARVIGALQGLDPADVSWSYLGAWDGSASLRWGRGADSVSMRVLGLSDAVVLHPPEGAEGDTALNALPWDPNRPLSSRVGWAVLRWERVTPSYVGSTWVAGDVVQEMSAVQGLGTLSDLPDFGSVGTSSVSLHHGVRARLGDASWVVTGAEGRLLPVRTESWDDLTLPRAAWVDEQVHGSGGGWVGGAWEPGDWEVEGGLRGEAFALPSGTTAGVSPRIALLAPLGPQLDARWGVGRQVALPPPSSTSRVLGDPAVGPEAAWTTQFGLVATPDPGIAVAWNAWAGRLDAVVVETERTTLVVRDVDEAGRPLGSTEDVVHVELGEGTTMGTDLSVRYDGGARVFGSASLTLGRSQRRVAIESFVADQDEPIALDLLVGMHLPWRVDGTVRVQVASGHPFTPSWPVYDPWADVVDGLAGPTNGARLPAYRQVDLHLERAWLAHRSTWRVTVDVVNLTNTRNALVATYDATYRQVVPTLWLPILPTAGLRVTF